MQRSLLLLALTALAASAVRAQTVQSGLLYWCSFTEGGSNFASLGGARANWLGFNSGSWSGPCHLPYSGSVIAPQWTDGFPYIYTNGSAYPYTDYAYKVAPVACLVSNA